MARTIVEAGYIHELYCQANDIKRIIHLAGTRAQKGAYRLNHQVMLLYAALN